MNLKLILIMMLVVSTQAIRNRSNMCFALKQSLWVMGSHIKNSEKEIKDNLWEFSYRKLTYKMLILAEYDTNVKNAIMRVINEVQVLRQDYLLLSETPKTKISEEMNLLVGDSTSLARIIQTFTDSYNVISENLKKGFSFLKNKKNIILNQNVETQTNLNKILKIDDTLLLMDITTNASPSEYSILEDALTIILINAGQAVTFFEEYKKIYFENNIYKETIEGQTQLYKILKTEMVPTLKKNVADLQYIQTSKEKLVIAARVKIVNLLKAEKKALSQLVFADKDYLAFFNKKKEMNNLKTQKEQINKHLREARIMAKVNAWKVQRNSWKITRISPSLLFNLNEEITILEKVSTMLPNQTFPRDIEVQLLENIYLENQRQMQVISQKLVKSKQIRSILEQIVLKEKEVDLFFVNLLVDVQGNILSREKSSLCFSDEELSVFFYYASISQIIYSKKSFVDTYFNKMSLDMAYKLPETMLRPFVNQNYIDTILPFGNHPPYSPELYKELANNYSFLVNSNLEEFYKEQKIVYFDEQSRFMKILAFLGINRANFLDILKNTLYNKYFGVIAAGLIDLVGLHAGIPFLTSLITSFLCFFMDIILSWIAKVPAIATKVKTALFEAMRKVFKYLFVTEYESLDFEEEITTFTDLDQVSLVGSFLGEQDELTNRFKTLFENLNPHPEFMLRLEFTEQLSRMLI